MTADGILLVLLANVASTLFMVGLIWFVQVVHYPAFTRVGTRTFDTYHAAHLRRTSWLVAAPMFIEGLTAATLAWRPPLPQTTTLCWLGLALVLVIWVSTVLFQVPRHKILARGFEAAVHHQLVTSNWIRTIAWTARGALVLVLLYRAIAGGTNHA